MASFCWAWWPIRLTKWRARSLGECLRCDSDSSRHAGGGPNPRAGGGAAPAAGLAAAGTGWRPRLPLGWTRRESSESRGREAPPADPGPGEGDTGHRRGCWQAGVCSVRAGKQGPGVSSALVLRERKSFCSASRHGELASQTSNRARTTCHDTTATRPGRSSGPGSPTTNRHYRVGPSTAIGATIRVTEPPPYRRAFGLSRSRRAPTAGTGRVVDLESTPTKLVTWPPP